LTNWEKGSKPHLPADNFCERTILRFSWYSVLFSSSFEMLANKFWEEKERWMSRQRRSKSSSDFVREKTDKEILRECTFSFLFRVFLRFFICCRLFIGKQLLPYLQLDITMYFIYLYMSLEFIYIVVYYSSCDSTIVNLIQISYPKIL